MKKCRFEIWLFFVYLLLALAFTWPLATKFNSSVYGLRGDHFGQLWFDWWGKKALLLGKSLSNTPLLDAPFGFSYNVAGLEQLHLLLRFVLTLLTNEVLSLNIWLLLSFPLSGLAVYFLVKHLTGNKLSAAFSGLVYSFSMYHFSHAWEHSSLIFIFWMPLYVWALVRLNEKQSVRNATIAAALFAAVLLDNFYYGYFTFFFTIFFFLFQIRRWFNRRGLELLLLFSVLCLLFSAPFIFPTVRTLVTGNVGGELEPQAYQRSLADLNWLSARPWYYLLPSPWHPLWGKYSRKILDWIATKPPYYLTQQYDGNEHNLYLTWTALILSAFAVFTPQRKTLRVSSPAHRSLGEGGSTLRVGESAAAVYVPLFLCLGIVMAIFSAPPYATISLHKIYFPSHFLYQVFPMFRAYARFGVLVLLCVSVLAGFGLDYLLRRHKMPQLLTIVLSGFVILEVFLPSFNVDLTPPAAYQWLAKQEGDFIVMDYPSRTDHSDLLYQRVHHKRLFDPQREGGKKFLQEQKSQNLSKLSNELKELGVKYILFHENDSVTPVAADYFEREGFEVVEKFPGIIVFEVVGK